MTRAIRTLVLRPGRRAFAPSQHVLEAPACPPRFGPTGPPSPDAARLAEAGCGLRRRLRTSHFPPCRGRRPG